MHSGFALTCSGNSVRRRLPVPPIDVLLRVLNVAGFAMDAILRVDLQPLLAAPGLLDDLVYPGRTIALLRRVVEPIIDLDRLCRVAQLQMRRLVLLVVGVRDEHRGWPVEADV